MDTPIVPGSHEAGNVRRNRKLKASKRNSRADVKLCFHVNSVPSPSSLSAV